MTISALTKIGLAKESAWGVSTAPTVLLPITTVTLNEVWEQVLDEAKRGILAKDFNAYQGVNHIEGSLEGPFYPEEVGMLLHTIMGTSSTPSGTGPYTHVMTLGVTPPSLSIQDEDGVRNMRYLGVKCNNFAAKFSAAEGLLTYTASLTGKLIDQNVNTLAITVPPNMSVSDNTSKTWRGWQSSVTINSTAYTKMITFDLTIAREVSLVYTANNTRFASAIYSGPMEVTAKLSILFDTAADFDRAHDWGNNQHPLEVTLDNGLSGANNRKVIFTMSKASWGDGNFERDRGGTYMTGSWNIRALYNTTDSGPIKITLVNGRSSQY